MSYKMYLSLLTALICHVKHVSLIVDGWISGLNVSEQEYLVLRFRHYYTFQRKLIS